MINSTCVALFIIGGLIWGGFLGFFQFHWLYISSKKAIDKGVKPISNPLRMFLFAGALFVPAFIGKYSLYALLATFGGFAIGFAVWWIWFKIHLSSGGK